MKTRMMALVLLVVSACAGTSEHGFGFYTQCATPDHLLLFQGHAEGYNTEQPEAWVFRGMRMTVVDSANGLNTIAAPFTLVIHEGPRFDAGGGMVTVGQFNPIGPSVWQGPSFCAMLGVPLAESTRTVIYREP